MIARFARSRRLRPIFAAAAGLAFTAAAAAQETPAPEAVPAPASPPVESLAPPPPPPPPLPTLEPAAPAPEPETPAEPNGAVTVTPAEPEPDAGQEPPAGNPNLISIALDNVPLEDVVRLFTRISGANIIATTSNLQGTVTVNLKDVEWKPALGSILAAHGLLLAEQTPGSEIYTIISRPAGAPEPMFTETLFLKYASVSNATTVIRPLLPAGASLSPYFPANALVLRSTEASLGEIRKIVDKIDTPRQQVFIEAKFIELNDQAIEDLGVNWQMLEGFGISATGLKDSITETKRRSNIDSQGVLGIQEKRYTRSRDLAGGNVIAGTDLGLDGVNRQLLDSKLTGKNISDYEYDPETGAITWELVPSYALERVRTAILSADDLKLTLSALKQTDGVTVVSNPKIIIANEEPALIHIGETERPFISTITPGNDNTDPTVTYNPGDPVDLGVKVRVTPTINTERHITVRIEPELTRRLEDAVAPNGQTFPIISTKRISTVFSMESGKTAAIGGLTETSEDMAEKKIPLLGDIPIIGKYLFSYSHKEKLQKETIIFVTVSLSNPEVIEKKSGLPEDSDLVHKYLLRHAQEKIDQEEELRRLEAAQEQARTTGAETPRKGFFSRLFRR